MIRNKNIPASKGYKERKKSEIIAHLYKAYYTAESLVMVMLKATLFLLGKMGQIECLPIQQKPIKGCYLKIIF